MKSLLFKLRNRRLRWRAISALVLGLWVITLALCVATVMLVVVGRAPGRPSVYEMMAFGPEILAFSTAGAVVTWRRPRMLAGWLLFTVGLAWTSAAVGPGGLPAVGLAAWVSNWIWILAFVALPLFLLIFPDGRLPDARWRVVVWMCIVGGALGFTARAFMPGPLAEIPAITNPFGIAGATGPLRVADAVGDTLFPAVSVAAIVSLFIRFRHADLVQRRQLLWMALAGVVFVAMNGLANILLLLDITIDVSALFLGSFAAVPVAAAVAILRYRLYDIDRVVSNTVVYGALATFITTVFVLVVVGLGAVIGQGQASLPLSLLATALVAVSFRPVRERTQRLANRIVYGRRANPYEVLAAFSRRMGEPIATDALLPEMARILAEGTGATEATVWLVVGSDLRPAAVWPTPQGGVPPVRLVDGELPSDARSTRTVPVRHEEQLLGALTVTKPAGESLTPTESELLSDLAAQAGLALRNVRLIEELKASRQRIVAAQDSERRRLERDIHDGAQQRLVTLSLALRMARNRPGLTPALATALDTAAEELNDALVELRELARGIHPAILSEEGLGPALTSLAERSAIPTVVATAPTVRLPAAIEATAYHVASEALAAATQAGASTATVSAEHAAGRLVVELDHDGIGEDGATRLPGLIDRVAALDGRLETKPSTDRGTVVRAVIPCESF
jgi:signal transduction histidine kinase